MATLLRIFVGLLAFVAACLLASASFVTIVGAHASLEGGGGLANATTNIIPAYAFIIGYVALVPILLALFVLRTYGLRRWRHFAIAGAVIGLAAFAAMFIPALLDDARGTMADTLTYRMLWAFVVSGAAGGTGYWLIAFKLFGREEAHW